MFGYVLTDTPSLRICEYQVYHAYYCGLCQALGRYGQGARMLLSYDCAFLYLLQSAMTVAVKTAQPRRCPRHPLQKRPMLETDGADYAAAVNLLLGEANLRDKRQDGQACYAGAVIALLRPACRRARAAYPGLGESIDRHMSALFEVEARQEVEIDRAAHPFAQLLSEVFRGAYAPDAEIFGALGYALGRFIYLADAWEDRAADEKRGNYNVFVQKFAGDEEAARDSAAFNLHSAVNAAAQAYARLTLQKNRALLENIIYCGIPQEAERVLRGEPRKKERGYGSL